MTEFTAEQKTTIREKYKTMTQEDFQKEFEKADQFTQITMAFTLALKKIFFSELHDDIKADALHAAVIFFMTACDANILEKIAKCHIETRTPMDMVVALIGKCSMEEEEKALNRFRTMMKLFNFKV